MSASRHQPCANDAVRAIVLDGVFASLRTQAAFARTLSPPYFLYHRHGVSLLLDFTAKWRAWVGEVLITQARLTHDLLHGCARSTTVGTAW